MTYKIVESMFFASDTVVETGLSEEEANKLCNSFNVDSDSYTWYTVVPETTN